MTQNNRQIAIWLFICCFMVAMMVMIGGVTRLTESGLSMTNWKPITGWLPPIGEQHWLEEFASYQKSPEYQKINYGMSVHEFKSIFWLEFIHRLAGRITGFVFFIPFLYFLAKGAVDFRLGTRLFGILLLGGFQGIVGWLMVSSGLKDAPHVSQYWLAFHLSMAFIIFSMLFLLAVSHYHREHKLHNENIPSGVKKMAVFTTVIIAVQIIWGAFVAGLDAGLIYNTFPLMDGHLIPGGLFASGYLSIFDDVKTVQFVHRALAYFVVLVVFILWLKARKAAVEGWSKYVINLMFVMVFVQFGLGVFTLLYAVPIPLASMHQMGALILFGLSIYSNYLVRVGR